MKKEKLLNWTKTENHIYNKEVIKCDVYAKSFGRGTVYVLDSKDQSFMYICSFGANSDYSFTGSFYKLPVNSIEEAIRALDKFTPLHLKDKNPKIENLIN